eukprot:Skav218645  [mRNA]  locus=scaffold365:537626:546553:- [translate_table: standard]
MQLKHDVHLLRGGLGLTHSVDFDKWLVFKVYSLIPFLEELRVLTDWTVTSTSMNLFMWFKLEDACQNLYKTKCDMNARRYVKPACERPLQEKLLQGTLRGRTVNPALATDTANWRPRLNFPTSVRECRSVSPRIYEPRQLRGNFVREGDRIRTGSMPPETTVTHMPGFGRERSRPRDERSTGATATRSTGSHAAASTRR